MEPIREGDKVRITLLRDVEGSVNGRKRIVDKAGTVYMGTVANLNWLGLFDLINDDEPTGWYMHDPAIKIEVIQTPLFA